MSLKASALKVNEGQKKAIAREVSAILPRIDEEIKLAHDQGKHKEGVYVNLPITFAIPYMANKDAQRVIYYKILTSLCERDFHVEIKLTSVATIFHIKWLSDDEINEIVLQNTVLAKHSDSTYKDN